MKSKKILITVLIILAIIFVFLIVFKDNILKIIYPNTYIEIIEKYSEEYNVDSNLILAVIKAESNFDEKAVSNKNAIGLMQIIPSTAKDVVNMKGLEIDTNNIEKELLIPEKNIEIGTAYLSMLLNRYDSIEIVLASYNAGIGTVDNWIEKEIINKNGIDVENIPYKETNYYVRKVINNYEIYTELYGT